jgi:glycosyltransferase involved in cell wall biosynthesis
MNEGVIVVTGESFPNGMAATNHIIALAKGFLLNDIKAEVVTFNKTKFNSRFSQERSFQGIPFINLLIVHREDSLILNYFYKFWKYVLLFNYIFRTPKNKVLYFYSNDFIAALIIFVIKSIKGQLFVKEETEHPLIRTKGFNQLFKSVYLNNFYIFFNFIVVISFKLESYFKENYNIQCIRINNFCDVSINYVKIPSINRRTFKIVFAGVISKEKEGIDLLLNALSIVKDSGSKILLDVYGVFPTESERLDFFNQLVHFNITDEVTFCGQVDKDIVSKAIQNSEILVLSRPSNIQTQYGFSSKLLEYLLSGNPVITTNVGDINLYLDHNVDCFICKPDSNSIAFYLLYIINNYEKALNIGLNGRDKVLNNFNPKIETNKLLKPFELLN